jgi:ubiquinone biosynthesis protein COQ9
MTDIIAKDRILDAALDEAVFDGWTQGALERAAQKAGHTNFDAKRAFPRGPIDALNYFSERADERLRTQLANDYDMPSLKIRERIATAVMARLRANSQHREAIRRALAVYAMPWNAADGLKNLYATVDVMWRAAGDTSTDYNYYTKRLLLSQVYSSTVYVWLDDTTTDLSETEAFLRRRIDNVMQIEKFKAKAKEGLGKLEEWLPPSLRRA